MQKKLSKKLGEKLFLLPYLIALTSGVVMGLTVAPVNAWFLAWIALAPLWVLVITSAKRKNQSPPASPAPPAPPAPPALFWGIGYHGVALFWITGIHPMDWLGVPWWPSLAITVFCWSFISLYGGLFVTIWAAMMTRVAKQKPWLRILIGTSIWCALEALWSAGPLWWSSLAYTQSPHNLIILHLGQLSGTTTITATIVTINGLIAEAWINRPPGSPVLHLGRSPYGFGSCSTWGDPKTALPHQDGGWTHQDAKNAKNFSAPLAPWRFVNPYLAIATTLLITLHLIGFTLYSQPIAQPPAAALKIGVIQGNIPNKIKLTSEGLRRAITGYTNGYLTLINQGVDAVLTPEGAMPFFQRDLGETPLVSAVKEKGIVAWVGAFGERGRSYTNSLFTVIGSGEITSRYDKAKLVPLGEYIPFESILGGIISRLSPLDEHQVPGAANQIFDTPFGRAIVGICYESAFPEQFRRQAAKGGQFILSSSNDAHYSASMPFQHHAQDIMRAIETDRWAARATNTGYSAFVDPHGRTLWISRYNTYETHAETIYRRQTQTFYVRWGDWLMPLLLGVSVIAWGFNIFWQNDCSSKSR